MNSNNNKSDVNPVVDNCVVANRIYEQTKLDDLDENTEKPTKYSWIDDFLWENKIRPPRSAFFSINPDEALWNKFVFGYIRNYWKTNKIYYIDSCPKEVILLLIAFSVSKRIKTDSNTIAPKTIKINVSLDKTEVSIENYISYSIEIVSVHSVVYRYYGSRIKRKDIRDVKKEILTMNNIRDSRHDDYKIWFWNESIRNHKNKFAGHGQPPFLKDSNKKLNDDKFYIYGWRGYICLKSNLFADEKLRENENYIISVSKPTYKSQGKLFGWPGYNTYYTAEELYDYGFDRNKNFK